MNKNDTTYAVYGEDGNGKRAYVGSMDDPPAPAFIDRWKDEEDGYPVVIVSEDVFIFDQGNWTSTETRYERDTKENTTA